MIIDSDKLSDLRARLEWWGVELIKLKEIADTKEGELKLEYYSHIDTLMRKLEQAWALLQETDLHSNNMTPDLRKRVHQTWLNLEDLIKEAAHKIVI